MIVNLNLSKEVQVKMNLELEKSFTLAVDKYNRGLIVKGDILTAVLEFVDNGEELIEVEKRIDSI